MKDWKQKLEERLAELTEDDAGYKLALAYHLRLNLPWEFSLEAYKEQVRFNERDCQQMIEMGR